MRNAKIIVTLGILVMIMPFSGLPSLWRTSLFVIFGAIIAILAFRLLPIRKSSVDARESKINPTTEEDNVVEKKANEEKDTQEKKNHG